MTLVLSVVFACAVVCVVLMLFFMVMDAMYPAPPSRANPPRHAAIESYAGADCTPDGVAITSQDRLRMAVIYADTLVWKQRTPSGRPVTMADIRDDADAFARLQSAPDVTLSQLAQCDGALLGKYSHGFWLITSALARESARRRGTAVHPDIHDARAP